MVMAILSISALLLFRIPEITYYKGIYFNETLQDCLIAIVGLICVLIVKPPTISYFGWPRLKWLGGFAFALAAIWVTSNSTSLAQTIETICPAGNNFVYIRLMPGIKEHYISW